jgi:ATP-dependent DNA helicase MPH1
LDIGEVDGIFCYDGGMSVIRMIQRMGRTGRKRDGSVFMLLMEGKEVDDYMKAHKKSKAVKKNMKQAKYELYGFNPSLFEECSLIPISFFEG